MKDPSGYLDFPFHITDVDGDDLMIDSEEYYYDDFELDDLDSEYYDDDIVLDGSGSGPSWEYDDNFDFIDEADVDSEDEDTENERCLKAAQEDCMDMFFSHECDGNCRKCKYIECF